MTLPVSYYVYGTIRDHTSSPINGAKVHIQDTDNDQGVVTFTTGADGKYQINVQTNFNDTDTGLIWATGSGEYKKQAITVDVSHAALNVDLTLEELIYQENVGTLDDKTRAPSRILADATGIIDIPSRFLTRTYADTLGLVDTANKHPQRILSDSLGTVDTFFKQPQRIVSDYIGIIDTKIVSVDRVISDIAGLKDTIGPRDLVRVFTAELIGIVDTYEKLIHKLITVSDALGIADTPGARTITRNITDAAGLVDTISRSATRIISDAAGLLDARTVGINRTLTTELVGLLDTHEKLVHKLITISDALGLASPLPEKTLTRTIARSTELVETPQKDMARTLSLEIAGILDTHEKLIHKLITITDMIGLGDTTGPRQLSAIRTDTSGLYDTRNIDATREISDTIGLTDSVNRQLDRLFSDKVEVVESATKQVAKIFADSLGLSEATTRQLERVLTDTIGVFESHNISLSRLFADKIGLLGSTSYQITGGGQKFKTVEEMMGLADSIGYRIISRTITDGVGITDSRLVALTRELNDLISVADSHTKLVHKIITISEAIGVSDSALKKLDRILVDATELADILSRQAAFIRTFSESIGVLTNAPKEIRRVIVENAALKHTVERAIGRSVLELLSIIDTTGTREFSREITELLAPRGIISRDITRIIPTETIEITDMITVPTFLSFYVDLFLGHIGYIQNTFDQYGSVTITFN